MVPIRSPLAHVVYLLPLFNYLAGSKSISVRPADPDKITNNKNKVSSSGKMIATVMLMNSEEPKGTFEWATIEWVHHQSLGAPLTTRRAIENSTSKLQPTFWKVSLI